LLKHLARRPSAMRTFLALVSLSTLVACNGAHPAAAPTSSDKADNSTPAGWAKATDTDLTKGTLSWKCKDPGNANYTLDLVHAHKAVTTESMGGYDLVTDSKPTDYSKSPTVFGVNTSELTFHLNGQQIELSASLQDYSDKMSWQVFLQADGEDTGTSYTAVMLSTYQSSDGDDQLHPDEAILQCDVLIAK
jgi:hypothetical protein